jgi:hypothetical protein
VLHCRSENGGGGQAVVWRTEFFGHEPQADIALIEKGFHAAYIDLTNMYGAPVSLDIMDECSGLKRPRRWMPCK